MTIRKRLTSFSLICVALVTASAAQPASKPAPRPASAEPRAARAYDAAVKQGPLAVRAFLARFPKGADLHVHLSGAVYAETFLRDAAEDGLCVDPAALKLVPAPCTAPLVPASRLNGVLSPADQDLYDRLLDSLSMRGFVPTPGYTGHDQFFSTFAKFGGIKPSHVGEWVDEIASRSAAQNQQYLELMDTPPFNHAATIAREINWPANSASVDLAQMRQALLDRGLRDEVSTDRDRVRTAEARRREIEHCNAGTAGGQATEACHVTVRYIYQVLRGFAPEQVFAQTLLGFETVAATLAAGEPGYLGINFVQPEDGFISMRDYTLQMRMIQYLHSVYPQVHITLHAGELAPGMVPPEGLRFHVRQAIELAHAERIGHGVDVMYEDDALALLKQMAAKHIMVEINLSSNEGILGVKGMLHPFPYYRAAHVPVALSTDDEGVSRIDITGEYTRVAVDYHLSYADLKQLARTGIEHSFLPGASLWAQPDVFTAAAGGCKGQALGGENPSATCKSFLAGSQKATEQWEQEKRFRAFEASY